MLYYSLMFFIRVKKKSSTKWKVHKDKALILIRTAIKKHNLDIHFDYNRITVRNQRTRWGSCSVKRNLNFNYRIVHLPEELIEYIVIHEFCHLKEFNHSKNFWDLVKTYDPDYRKHRREIKKIVLSDLLLDN